MQNYRKTKISVYVIRKLAAAWKINLNVGNYDVIGKKGNIQHVHPALAIIPKVSLCSKEKMVPVLKWSKNKQNVQIPVSNTS